MAERNYEELSVEDLERRLEEISLERAALREEAIQITAIRDRKVTMLRAQEKLAAMSPAERAAMHQIIAPVSIESQEAVGEL